MKSEQVWSVDCWIMVGESTAELNEVAVEINYDLAIWTTQ